MRTSLDSPVPSSPRIAIPADERERRLVALRAQLGEERANYRRERAEREQAMAEEIRGIAEARAELERQEAEVQTERQRLIHLRQRFLKRWKKHWSTQRRQIETESAALKQGVERLRRDAAALIDERAQFAAHKAKEEAALREGRAELNRETQRRREEWAQQRTEESRRREEIAARAGQLAEEQRQLRLDRQKVEERSARLRTEAEGLESRIFNTRATLLRLEQERAVRKTAHPSEPEAHEVRQAPPPQDREPEQKKLLVEAAETLEDQRRILIEHLADLQRAREDWRREQCELAVELEHLAEKLSRREEELQQRVEAVSHEENLQRREADELRRRQEDFDLQKTRHAVRELAARSDRHRAAAAMAEKIEWAGRRERAVAELFRRWSDRRKRELLVLRAEHERCLTLRQRWEADLGAMEQRNRELAEQRRELAERALLLEQLRQELLDESDNPLLAQRKLDRLGRRLRSAQAKAEADLLRQAERIAAERSQLEMLFRESLTRIEEARTSEANLADKIMEWEAQRAFFEARADTHLHQEQIGRAHREILEREVARLRHELDRLTQTSSQTLQAKIPTAFAA